ncbi:MAG: threonylcarbamoyl-AMP synthase [Oligoflexia bacterium]|nr:threonylcarbamoyl-AMP synthase [Oligoflexia bacterium]
MPSLISANNWIRISRFRAPNKIDVILSSSPENIAHAAKSLRSGGIVAFPTETVYGLGANALDAQAVAEIFRIKRRPATDPLIIHLADPREIELVADLSNPAVRRRLQQLNRFWPGPLSVVLPKKTAVPDAVTAGLPSVAVRIPRHPVALALIKASGVPVAAPSANPFSYISPTTAQHVVDNLGEQVSIVLDGGPCEIGLESTVISLTSEVPEILRPGAITLESISKALDTRVMRSLGTVAQGAAPGPGMLREHYSPHTKVELWDRSSRAPSGRVGFVSINGSQHDRASLERYEAFRALSADGDLEEAASKLFSTLRELDRMGLDLIVVDTCNREGLGAAIMDRLTRASARS